MKASEVVSVDGEVDVEASDDRENVGCVSIPVDLVASVVVEMDSEVSFVSEVIVSVVEPVVIVSDDVVD